MELNDLIAKVAQGAWRLTKHRVKRNADLVTVNDPVHSVRIADEHLLIHHGGKTVRLKTKDLEQIEFDEGSSKITCRGPIIVMQQHKLKLGGGWYEKLSSGVRLELVAN